MNSIHTFSWVFELTHTKHIKSIGLQAKRLACQNRLVYSICWTNNEFEKKNNVLFAAVFEPNKQICFEFVRNKKSTRESVYRIGHKGCCLAQTFLQ